MLSLDWDERSELSCGAKRRSKSHFKPYFDVTETLQAFVLEVELPGVSDKKAVDIELTNNQELIIRATTSNATTSTTSASETRSLVKGEGLDLQPDYETGNQATKRSFERTLKLRCTIDQDNVTAKLADGGILIIVIPKAPGRKVRVQ